MVVVDHHQIRLHRAHAWIMPVDTAGASGGLASATGSTGPRPRPQDGPLTRGAEPVTVR